MKVFKEKMAFALRQELGNVRTINSQSVRVYSEDENSKVAFCSGTVTVTDGGAGYAKGCLYIKTDVSTGTSGLYKNDGTTSSCDFNLIEGSEGLLTAFTAGLGLTGGGTEGSVTGNVGAGHGIAVRADAVDVGVNVYNNTGGTLAAGTLLNLSGFTGTDGVVVTKADADAGAFATHVVVDAINNNTAGVVYPLATVTGVNTGGRTIGDPVYLDATTAGGFTFTAPTGADQGVQIVGVVKVVHASTGEISFFPGITRITKLPTSVLQDLAVTTAKLAAGSVTPAKLGANEAITATADGTGTGAISGNSQSVTVTSSGATQQVSLPASSASLLGKTILIWVGANGFELITPAASNATINNVNSDGTNQADIAANTLTKATLVATDTWIVENFSNLGAVNTAIVPDND